MALAARVVLVLCALLGSTAAVLLPPHAHQPREEIVIDGKSNTIGLTVADFISGAIPDTFTSVVNVIVSVLSPPPEEDIDYFGIIKEDVQQVVGDYINQHNMDQIEQYKDDLASLLLRYSEAPVSSSTYPDKNTMANSLSTSIVANRFLIEAVENPHSMMLHYADIASIHIMVLQDAAETYTTSAEAPSYWWVDLDSELDHYIKFGRNLEDTVIDWRNDLMECSYEECIKEEQAAGKGSCYDVWTVVDHVSGVVDNCRVVHGDTSCDDHCQAYQIEMNREVSLFVFYYLGRVMTQWENLKLLADEMAAIAKPT